MSKNSRLRKRIVRWQPEFHTVYRFDGTMRVTLDDAAEPDRPVELQLTDDDARYLAARLAQQLGYKLVQPEQAETGR